MGSGVPVSISYGATVFQKEISLKKLISFQTGFSGRADVFQIPRLQQYPVVGCHVFGSLFIEVTARHQNNTLYPGRL
jgi:hypothetical protein